MGIRWNQEGFEGAARGIGHPIGAVPEKWTWTFHRAVLRFLLCSFFLLSAVACDSIDEFVDERASQSTAVPPTSTTEATGLPTPGTVPTATTAPSASGLVLPVTVAAVPDDLPKYDRGTWRHWVDEDGDCQNARQEVLIAESSTSVTFESDEQCRVAAGSWQGPYTGKTVNSPSELDIDHLVPLENAHRSGGWAWDRERKRNFANYLGYEHHLIATTSSANRSKGSKGPEEWRPDLESYWCSYATAWVTVKNEWGLTVTQSEYTALAEMLSTCGMPVLLQPTGGTPPPVPTSTPAPTPPAGLRYDPFGPDRNCGDFDSYEEALAFFLAAGGPDTDRHRLDVDGDGEPCETLPGGPGARASPDDSGSTTALYATFSTPEPVASQECPTQSQAGTPASPCGSVQRSPSRESGRPHTPEATPTETPVPISTPTSSPTPIPTPTPESSTSADETFMDRNCGDYADWQEAQEFFLSEGGPEDDPHGLDRDGDGVACQSLPGAPSSQRETPTPTQVPTPTPGTDHQTAAATPAFVELPFDPGGPDRDCSDFTSWWEAQNFFLAAGGPEEDHHRLDHNGDGIVCESLDGAPQEDPPQSGFSSSSYVGGESDSVDRNCGDFETWQQAQDFFLSEGGPTDDPHRLDHNGDGIVCESLDGAPEEDSPPSGSSSGSSSGGESDIVDRDCGDFETWREAQDFFLSEGGPAEDPHRLDHNGDGIVCESLDGAPEEDAPPSGSASSSPSGGESDFVDRDCGDFETWQEAQQFFKSEGGPAEDHHHLDHNGDGIVCESLDGAPQEDAPPSGSASSSPGGGESDFVDRDCGDFETWQEAQQFFKSEGGPAEDPHHLDHNGDGTACESLPGAPVEDRVEEFVDRNCSDFDTWREAQDFFEAQGGPAEDSHRLDRDGDGTACESLPGAPKDDN